ncbi:lipoyl(octanoyl) transferase LipB [uncultured Desulfovibrio sp.]|uniref:lipoyl(octanoyl) transferase LipB n=1 Tax=uncultured Desulfovibrio sp. TaxID=167968 RepID=UPI002604DCCA|nr:lipoyl(octanoyl) transferase LipB [uncultured Desulfovibrio sp.]
MAIIIDLGRMPYRQALEIQRSRHEEVRQGAEDTLFLVEHPPVVTLGRHGGLEHLHLSEEELARRGIELAATERGGNITCHFPGQLVGYPIVRIGRRTGGLHGFVHLLEETVIRTAAAFGVTAARRPGFPGVWIGRGKLCSIGLGVRRWVTFHGFALNVGRDLSLFDAITLCGLADAHPTSLSRERNDASLSPQEVKDVCAREFQALIAHPPLAARQAAL